MKKLLIISLLLVAGCATKPNNNYQIADLNAIIVPKNVQQKEITVSRMTYSTTGEQSIETTKFVVPNIFYPNDSTYLCSGEKAKKDLGAVIDNMANTVKK